MKEIEIKRVELLLLDMTGEVYQLGMNILKVIESEEITNVEKIKTTKGSIEHLTKLGKVLEQREEYKDLEEFVKLKQSIKTVRESLEINLEYLIEISELEKLRDRLRAI